MKKKFYASVATGLFLIGMSGVASATLVSVTGNGGIIGTGTNLQSGFSEDERIQGYNEGQNVTIGPNSPVWVNYLNPTGNLAGTDVTGGELAAGTYDSFLLHYDAPGAGIASTGTINAIFTFSSDIVGIITSTTLLDNSDNIFGLSSLTYTTPGNLGRRTESSDTFTVDGNILTLTLFGTNRSWIDEMRIITQADQEQAPAPVPEPATMLLFGTGLIGLAGLRNRMKKKA